MCLESNFLACVLEITICYMLALCFRTKKKTFTYTQKLALVMLAVVEFMSFCSCSIMAPFYPKEASAKGMSESMAGFVFSFYALVMFISSPIFGKIVEYKIVSCLLDRK